MEMAKAQNLLVLLVLLVTISCLAAASQAHQKIHIVGGSFGWKIPQNITFYDDWGKTKTFLVGDRLVFLYTSGLQNVVEVSTEDDFAGCKQENVTDIHFMGPTLLDLTTPGPHYFYCGVGLHCEHGQKLKIDVAAALPPPPPQQ